jgi:hypothetical protein
LLDFKKKDSIMKKMVFEKNKNRGYQKTERNNRFLVTINIMGSSGPIRFVVNEKELVSGVIDTSLKSYAKEGRLPVLGFNATNFLLYHPNAGFDGMISYPFGYFVLSVSLNITLFRKNYRD